MSNPNQPRDERGRFSAGSAGGDHQPEARDPNDRRVVAPHNGAMSVGTHLSAKQERINLRMAADERHYPTRSDAAVAALTDRGRPQAGLTSTPGRFRYQPPRRH